MRNEVKKKAKVVVEHAYGLTEKSTTQRASAAQWLLKTHHVKVKGGQREIPNFVFPDINITWRNDKIDLKVCIIPPVCSQNTTQTYKYLNFRTAQ